MRHIACPSRTLAYLCAPVSFPQLPTTVLWGCGRERTKDFGMYFFRKLHHMKRFSDSVSASNPNVPWPGLGRSRYRQIIVFIYYYSA